MKRVAQGRPWPHTFPFSLAEFRECLIRWGEAHFQDLPWRHTRDPYKVLIAEVLLHRTQARQVVPIYREFLQSYPSLASLSSAPQQEIASILMPLGLRWRTNLLLRMVEVIEARHGGEIPRAYGELMELPGISHYIAAAVRCFAFGMPEAVIDTNTVRVLGRVLGVQVRDSTRRTVAMREIAYGLLDVDRPGEYNFSLLDLAHQVCTVRTPPACSVCPLVSMCKFTQHGPSVT